MNILDVEFRYEDSLLGASFYLNTTYNRKTCSK